MRLIYFSRDYSSHDHRFLSFLAGTGNEVYFLRLEQKPASMENRPLPPGITPVGWVGGSEGFKFSKSALFLADLERVIAEIQPDLIHAGPIPQTAYLAAKSGFQPLVSMSWGSDLLLESVEDKAVEARCRYALSKTTVMLGDCRAVQERAGQLGFPEDRTVLFPWGVDLQKFSPGTNQNFRKKLGWQDNFVLLSLRSWEPIYGVDLILQAFASAVRQKPELRLILLGKGSQENTLKPIIREHNLGDKIYLGGAVSNDELPEIYQAADLYLSASFSDGSSVSLMEALASGLPVLVSDIPGNLEWVKHGREGWVFASGESAALTQGMLNAVGQKNQLAGMGMASRLCAMKKADQTRNFPRLLEAYHLALSLTNPSAGGVNNL